MKPLYRLNVRESGHAVLYMIKRTPDAFGNVSNDRRDLAVMPATLWERVAHKIEKHFGDRMEAAGLERIILPTRGEDFGIPARLATELSVLMVATHDYQNAEKVFFMWSDATPEWRQDLAQLVLTEKEMPWPDGVGATCLPQALSEALLMRAPDGTRDQDKEAAINAHRFALMSQINAIRRKQNPQHWSSKASWS
jgi:hypothetical protein